LNTPPDLAAGGYQLRRLFSAPPVPFQLPVPGQGGADPRRLTFAPRRTVLVRLFCARRGAARRLSGRSVEARRRGKESRHPPPRLERSGHPRRLRERRGAGAVKQAPPGGPPLRRGSSALSTHTTGHARSGGPARAPSEKAAHAPPRPDCRRPPPLEVKHLAAGAGVGAGPAVVDTAPAGCGACVASYVCAREGDSCGASAASQAAVLAWGGQAASLVRRASGSHLAGGGVYSGRQQADRAASTPPVRRLAHPPRACPPLTAVVGVPPAPQERVVSLLPQDRRADAQASAPPP